VAVVAVAARRDTHREHRIHDRAVLGPVVRGAANRQHARQQPAPTHLPPRPARPPLLPPPRGAPPTSQPAFRRRRTHQGRGPATGRGAVAVDHAQRPREPIS
jgi:hypothetical protein